MQSSGAKEKVQVFVNVSPSSIQYKGIKNVDIGNYYVFDTGNGQAYVNMYTGTVERAWFADALKSSGEVKLDLAAAESVAKKYAGEKYTGFLDKNMQLLGSGLINHGDAGNEYSFIWREKVNRAQTPNMVVVNVNPTSGKVISYIGIERDVSYTLEPEISQDKATRIAEDQFPGIHVINSKADLSVEYAKPGIQSLTWVVTLKGEPVDHVLQGGLVVIDALTGKVLLTEPYL